MQASVVKTAEKKQRRVSEMNDDIRRPACQTKRIKKHAVATSTIPLQSVRSKWTFLTILRGLRTDLSASRLLLIHWRRTRLAIIDSRVRRSSYTRNAMTMLGGNIWKRVGFTSRTTIGTYFLIRGIKYSLTLFFHFIQRGPNNCGLEGSQNRGESSTSAGCKLQGLHTKTHQLFTRLRQKLKVLASEIEKSRHQDPKQCPTKTFGGSFGGGQIVSSILRYFVFSNAHISSETPDSQSPYQEI